MFQTIAISVAFDLFPEDGKYIYSLQSFVTLVPDLHSQENPQWNLNGLLEVDRLDPHKLVLRVSFGKVLCISYFMCVCVCLYRSNLTRVVTQSNWRLTFCLNPLWFII